MLDALWNTFAVIGLLSVITSSILVLLVVKHEFEYQKHVKQVQELRRNSRLT